MSLHLNLANEGFENVYGWSTHLILMNFHPQTQKGLQTVICDSLI